MEQLATSDVEQVVRLVDEAGDPTLDTPLAQRESQTLVFLLSGDSKKQIAQKLGPSEHTVNDYLKNLHKRFDVNSRAELQAFFMNGGQR